MADNPLAHITDLEAVRTSLRELQMAARLARTREDIPRKATADEIALAETERQPWQCSKHSSRTGLPCRKARIPGGVVCVSHGGSARQVRRKARKRLLAEVDQTLARLVELRDQGDHLPTSMAAVKTILDRVMPALRREQRDGAAGPKGPIIQIGVAVGGVVAPSAAPVPQITVGTVPAPPVDGEVTEE